VRRGAWHFTISNPNKLYTGQAKMTNRDVNRDINPANQSDANLDPISREVGSHPLGTAMGAAFAA